MTLVLKLEIYPFNSNRLNGFGIITLVMLGNLAQIGIWGALFLWLGEFNTLQEAVSHSGVNFATLGYGDIVMSSPWKLLGPLEAVNGALIRSLGP